MSRVAYCATKQEFIQDVMVNRFMEKMKKGARENHIAAAPNEIRSWENNAPAIQNLLSLSGVPESVVVSFEYLVPHGGRIDCMLYGKDTGEEDHVVHLELKQWDNDSVHEIASNGVFRVEAYTGGGMRVVSHPSQQVENYQRHLLDYVEELSRPGTRLDGFAYCYRYERDGKPNDLYAPSYRDILGHFNLYSADQVRTLAERIGTLLGGGDGLAIFNRVSQSRIRQSKSLLDVVGNMFKGVTEFSLLDDQITAANMIFSEVEKGRGRKGKSVLIIKGGPGTGKTVIALHVLASLAAKHETANIFYTTRSKALRESLRRKLAAVSVTAADGHQSRADEMIANIYQFKPHNYDESAVDLLLVDEAHRVEKSANYMGTPRRRRRIFPRQCH